MANSMKRPTLQIEHKSSKVSEGRKTTKLYLMRHRGKPFDKATFTETTMKQATPEEKDGKWHYCVKALKYFGNKRDTDIQWQFNAAGLSKTDDPFKIAASYDIALANTETRWGFLVPVADKRVWSYPNLPQRQLVERDLALNKVNGLMTQGLRCDALRLRIPTSTRGQDLLPNAEYQRERLFNGYTAPTCPTCGHPYMEDWKVCPVDEYPLAKEGLTHPQIQIKASN